MRWAAQLHGGREVPGQPDIRVALTIGDRVFGAPSPPQVVRCGGVDELRYSSWHGDFRVAEGSARAALSANSDEVRGPRRVATLARTLVSRHLLRTGGLAFHAAAMVQRGRGYLFAGPSGAGKTTTVRTWPGELTLGDDYAIVAPACGGASDSLDHPFTVHGSPYSGREGTPSSPGSAPLAAIFLLEQAERSELVPLTPAAGLWDLLGSTIHFGVTRVDADTALATLERLVRSVRVARLRVSLDDPIWPVIEEVD